MTLVLVLGVSLLLLAILFAHGVELAAARSVVTHSAFGRIVGSRKAPSPSGASEITS